MKKKKKDLLQLQSNEIKSVFVQIHSQNCGKSRSVDLIFRHILTTYLESLPLVCRPLCIQCSVKKDITCGQSN